MTNDALEEGLRQLSNRVAEIERVLALMNETQGDLVEDMERDKVERTKP